MNWGLNQKKVKNEKPSEKKPRCSKQNFENTKEDFHYHCAHKFDKFDSKASKAIGVLLCNMCNPNEI